MGYGIRAGHADDARRDRALLGTLRQARANGIARFKPRLSPQAATTSPGAIECFVGGRARARRGSQRGSAPSPGLGRTGETIIKERSAGARRVARS